MPRDTEIAIGLHIVRPGWTNGAARVMIPRELAEQALPGEGAIAIRVVGPCLVLSRARFIARDEAKAEADLNFEAAIAEWQSSGAAHARNGKHPAD